jgi:hypothetical protein
MATRNPVSREKLIRSKREYVWLNSGTHPVNELLAVKPFRNIISSYYLLCMNVFDERCQEKGETVEVFIEKAMKTMNMTAAKADYYQRLIYMALFKKAENVVREKYLLQPKLDSFREYNREKKFEILIGNAFTEILKEYAHEIPPAEPSDETTLNELFSMRWFNVYENIVADINRNNYKDKLVLIDKLIVVNDKSRAIDKLYYSIAKVLAPYDKQLAIGFYLKHLHANPKNVKKDLQKTAYKKLFETATELETFRKIVRKLKSKKELDVALAEIPLIYEKPYKKIALNKAIIKIVIEKHSKTVATLNEILAEEEQPVIVTPKSESPALLNEIQLKFLLLFEKNNFSLSMEKVNRYIKGKNIFREQLVESINECCYEMLEDVLIESTGENYEIFEKYYRTVMASLH